MVAIKQKRIGIVMNIKVTKLTDWNLALNMARQTVGKTFVDNDPSDKWKYQMLRAEHSPIRCVQYLIQMIDVPYFAVMHLVRHHQGIEKFVCTQRSDRTGKDRHSLPQDALVCCSFICNAQALINISRVRLCTCADKETRKIWNAVKDEISKIDKAVADFMVPNCLYRGFCPELKSCGYFNTKAYEEWREVYYKGYNYIG